jgi:hypothetical protein
LNQRDLQPRCHTTALIGVYYIKKGLRTGASFSAAFRPGTAGKYGQPIKRIRKQFIPKNILDSLSVQLFHRVLGRKGTVKWKTGSTSTKPREAGGWESGRTAVGSAGPGTMKQRAGPPAPTPTTSGRAVADSPSRKKKIFKVALRPAFR